MAGSFLWPLAAALSENAVEEGVDHDVAPVDAELGQEPLYALPGFADEDPAHDRLVSGGILAEDQHSGRSIEASSVEDGSPFDAEVGGRVGLGAGERLHQRVVRPWIAPAVLMWHGQSMSAI
jgi:hypothetical protein